MKAASRRRPRLPEELALAQYFATADKEADWKAQDKLFDANKDWICDEKIMKLTNLRQHLHALSAVRPQLSRSPTPSIDGPHSVVYDQAENRIARAERRDGLHHERLSCRRYSTFPWPAATSSRPAREQTIQTPVEAR